MSWLKRTLIGVTVLLLAAIGVLAWLFRSQAEAIPDELPPIDTAHHDPRGLRLPADGDLPELAVAALAGKTAYFVIEDRESMQAGESKALNRALGRWQHPEGVVGYLIGDAKGFGLFRAKINEFMGVMRPEMRLPLYIDYEGTFYDTFKLPRGHTGLVVLGPTGEVLLRHSGPTDDATLDAVRKALGSVEPTFPPAPAFAVGELDNAACKGKVCVFGFLDAPVARADVPGVEGGFEGGREESFERFARPGIRLVGVLTGADPELDEDKVKGAIVGKLDGFELRRLRLVESAPEARAAFGIPDGAAALVIVDAEGRLALTVIGRVAFWQLGLVSDLIGVDLGDRHREPS
ncbi:MAG TPA: hypothetical protein PKW35_11615 [Nannocystaceae bacterium]|nr:hypothetical protein [Nannocystaceae bacterium]